MSAVTCCVCSDAAPVRAFSAKGYEHLRCTRCGTLFVHPPPGAEELARFYNSTYQVPAPPADAPLQPKWTARIAELAPHVPNGRVLEIGSSWGHFLAAARDAGWDAQGVEISADAAAFSTGRRGLQVYSGAFGDFAAAPGSFGAVVLWHVIEHESDPRRLLARIHELLAPGGLLALTTPNAASLAARLAGPGWEWVSPPAHLRLFTPQAMQRLLADAGFAAVQVGTRRGDARPFLADLCIAAAKRLLRHGAREPIPGAARPAVMTRPSFGQRLFIDGLDWLSWPFAPLGKLVNEVLGHGPELHVLARKPGRDLLKTGC